MYKYYNVKFFVDLEILRKNADENYKKIVSEKTKNIPESLFIKIINKAIEVLNDETQEFNMRMTAGILLILSQTGLRPQDLLGIRVNDLKETTISSSNIKNFYLHYKSRKPSKEFSDMLEFDIYASELCVQAFKTMLKLREKSTCSKENYLYILENCTGTDKLYPIKHDKLKDNYYNFLLKYLENQVEKDWEGIRKIVVRRWDVNECKYVKKLYSCPTLMQYRVHLATSLYNNGIPLAYIQKYMGHLSSMMTGYYIRPNNGFQEDTEYAKRIIDKIVNRDLTPLGANGEELKEKLKKFISDGNYNVKTDIQSIIDDLGEKLVIREKGQGLCCIKTSIIPCKNDARTNELLCAYGMCPNIYHFYDMIDVTYMQFHALQETYEYNKANGFDRAAQKELNKLKDFVRRRLNVELQELEKVVNKVGLNAFSQEHPDLALIAEKIDDIQKEVDIWLNL